MSALTILIATMTMSVMTIGGRAAPIKSSDAALQGTTDISGLHTHAGVQLTYINGQIEALEYYNKETYNLPHQNCFVRFEPTDDVDINIIKDDITSLIHLLPVIQQLANNETDEYIITKYNDIIKHMDSSITALNNLIEALESKDTAATTTQPITKPESDSTSDDKISDNPQPTDKPMDGQQSDKEMGTEADKRDDEQICKRLDKSVKLSALKFQVKLTIGDLELLQIN